LSSRAKADAPVTLGAALRDQWLLEPGLAFLNHGSYGAVPKAVLGVQDDLKRCQEQQPVAFMQRHLAEEIRRAAAVLAAFLGARGEHLAFVGNATEGVNAVAKSLDFDVGDQIVTTSHAYFSVRNTLANVCDRTGARLVVAALPLPIPGPEAVLEAVEAALTARTRLLVIDHVASPTATVLPVEELVALARRRGVPVLIDGAHGAGMLALHIQDLGADWYVGTCHKWLCAPRGSGFLWASPDAPATVHPPVTSRGPAEGFPQEFDWTGTRDYTPWLSVPAAIQFLERLGPNRLRAYCNGLAAEAGQMLAARWGSELAAPPSMLGAMATVRLPEFGPADRTTAVKLHDWLLDAHRIEVPVLLLSGSLWVRLSAPVYNGIEDYQRLGEAIAQWPPP
jgi:isopenicillin-N epimerase